MGRSRLEPPILRRLGVLFGVGLLQSVPAFGSGVEVSGGIQTSFDSEHRDIFGNAPAFSLAYSAPLTPRDVHFLLELGYVSNSGQVTWTSPTFEVPDGRYWLVPLVMGIRTNLISERDRGSLGLYLGFGVMTVFSGFEAPDGSSDTATGFGGMVEIRPQLKLNDRFAVWIRERISVSPDVSYHSWGSINYSGATLQLGMSLGAS